MQLNFAECYECCRILRKSVEEYEGALKIALERCKMSTINVSIEDSRGGLKSVERCWINSSRVESILHIISVQIVAEHKTVVPFSSL